MDKQIIINLLKNKTCDTCCMGGEPDCTSGAIHNTCLDWWVPEKWHCQYNPKIILLDPHEPHDDGCDCDPVPIDDK